MKRSVFSFVVFLFALGITTLSFAQASKATATAQPTAAQPASQEIKQPETAATTQAQSENKNVVKGIVKEVAKDKTYIMVDDNKILTTKEFLEDSYLEIGDKVEITVEKTDAGKKALSYNYIFEEDPSEDLDTQINEEETPAKEPIAPKAQ